MNTYFDYHIHGAAGVDFMTCTTKDMARACTLLGKNGVSLFAPTLLTSHPTVLEKALGNWGEFLQHISLNPRALPPGAAIPIGLHLEGPFLSKHAAGAHPQKNILEPNKRIFDHYWTLSQGTLAIMTLAPEVPGALPLIKHAVKRGVRVQLGHSRATGAQALRAIDAGATGITHLMNAMSFHHREPGLLQALITRPHVSAEIIADGTHVAPTFTALMAHSFKNQLYAVSDCIACAGLKNGATASLGALKVKRKGDIALTCTKPPTLAGSALLLPQHKKVLLTKLAGLKTPAPLIAAVHQLFTPRFFSTGKTIARK